MAVIEAISTTYLEADAASVTFSSIPATYEHLQLRFTAKNDRNLSSGYDFMLIRLNGDAGNNYASHYMQGEESTSSSAASAPDSSMRFLRTSNTNTNAADYGGGIIEILDYASINKYTTSRSLSFNTLMSAGFELARVALVSGLWLNTAAVSSITLSNDTATNWVRGSEFTLYGLNSA
jgi:hypothetical protein